MLPGQYEDGTLYWQFEKSELEARRKFEEAFLTPDLGELLEAVLTVSGKIAQQKAEAWQAMRDKIAEEFGCELEHLSYNRLTGRVIQQKEGGD